MIKTQISCIFKGTMMLFFFFADKGTFIIDKKRDVFNFFKHVQKYSSIILQKKRKRQF